MMTELNKIVASLLALPTGPATARKDACRVPMVCGVTEFVAIVPAGYDDPASTADMVRQQAAESPEDRPAWLLTGEIRMDRGGLVLLVQELKLHWTLAQFERERERQRKPGLPAVKIKPGASAGILPM